MMWHRPGFVLGGGREAHLKVRNLSAGYGPMLVLRDITLDQRGTPGGDPLSAPWRTIGFNLDGFCTDDADMRSECSPAADGQPPPVDGVGGTDNEFGNGFFPVVSLGAPGLDTDVVEQERAGVGALLLVLEDWNGEPNDSRVTVTVAQSVFGTPSGPSGTLPDITVVGSEAFLPDGTTPAPGPVWDGTDYFWARTDGFVAADRELPHVRVTTAYVSDGVLVARLPDRVPFKLLGTNVGLAGTAVVDASGAAGGASRRTSGLRVPLR